MTENTNFETDLKKYSDKLAKSKNGLTDNIAWLYGIFLARDFTDALGNWFADCLAAL